MGNRSRRERRAGQVQRAVDAGDPNAFEALSATNPETAAQHLARALSALPGDGASPLDRIAGELCGKLRRSGRLQAARRLGEAGAHRSTRLRLENALAAYALGEDEEAERMASADPEVAALLAPLLEAARAAATDATPPAPATKKPRKPKSSGDPTREARGALHGAAAAAKAVVLRQIAPARAAIRGVPAAQQGTVLTAELLAAIDLARPSRQSLGRAVDRLVRSPAVRASPSACAAVVHALADIDAAVALDAGKKLGLSLEALRTVQLRASAGPTTASATSPVQAAMSLAGAAGADVFDAPHRGAACLYEGFACLQADPKRAGRAFDRAIELGADLLEALRGKLLVAMADPGARCAGCGSYHDGPSKSRSDREVAISADRFARAARRVPSGAPFAVVASLIAVDGWEAEGDTKAAMAAIEAARAAAGGAMKGELDLREAHLQGPEHPERANALLDALIATDAGNTRAWQMKIDLAQATMDNARTDDLLIQAAAATRDPRLAANARGVRVQRGELAPFDGLVPGATTAGALAAEAAAWLIWTGKGDGGEPGRQLPAAGVACRAALPPAARVAFDAALLHVEAKAGKPDDAVQRLGTMVEQWWGSPKALATLAASTWVIDLHGHLVKVARSLAPRSDAGPALGALFDAAHAARDKSVAESLLKLGAASWSRSDIQERQRRLARMRYDVVDDPGLFSPHRHVEPGAALDPHAALREIEAALAPEFRLQAPDDEDDDEGLDFLDGVDADGLLDETHAAFKILGLSERDVQRLTPAQMDEMFQQVSRLAQGAATPAKLEAMRAIARRLVGKA